MAVTNVEPAIVHYPVVVRMLIIGGFAAAAWGGLIGLVRLVAPVVHRLI